MQSCSKVKIQQWMQCISAKITHVRPTMFNHECRSLANEWLQLVDPAWESINIQANKCTNVQAYECDRVRSCRFDTAPRWECNNRWQVSPPRSLMHGRHCSTMSVGAIRMNGGNRQIQHESPLTSKQINATLSKRMNATVATHVDSTMLRDENITTGGRYIRHGQWCMANLFNHESRSAKNE